MKKEKLIALRITQEQYKKILKKALAKGITVSKYIRQIINKEK